MSSRFGNLDVVIEKTSEFATQKLAKDLSLYLSDAKKQNSSVLFLSSGGSALSVLDFIHSDVLGEYLTIGVLDERYDKTNKDNNFTQLMQTEFYAAAKKIGCGFIDTSVREGQTQEELAVWFEKKIMDWIANNPGGSSIATVGVGTDGHTSGIMPFGEAHKMFEELFEGKNLVVAYDARGKNQFSKRITTTISFLKKIQKIFILMTGKKKKDAFLRMQEDGSIAEIPARILKKLHGVLYVDEALFPKEGMR